MTYFGFFQGMKYGKCNEDFGAYEKMQNDLIKSKVLAYMKQLPLAAIAPMTTKDIFTGQTIEQAGIIEDGRFTFPVDFIHYYEKYDIGIPKEYENYLISRI